MRTPSRATPSRELEAGPEGGRVTGVQLLLRTLSIYVGAAPLSAVLLLANALLSGVTPVVAAWLTKGLLDRLTHHGGPPVAVSAMALAVLGAVGAVAAQVDRYASRESGRRISIRTQAELFTAVSRLDGLAEVEDPGYRDRLQLALQSSQTGPQELVSALLGIGQSALTVLGMAGVLLAFSPTIALVVLCSAVPALVGQLRLARRRTDLYLANSPLVRRQLFFMALLTDLRAAKEIRLFGLGHFFRDRLLRDLGAAQQGERGMDRAALRVDGLLAGLGAAIAGSALVVAALRIGAGHGSIGEISVVTAALAVVQGGIASIAQQTAGLGQTAALLRHYFRLTAPPADRPSSRPVPPQTGEVELRDVWFQYAPGHPWVLKGLDLTIAPGESVALVGLNGAGKSTVVKLLCRLYRPTRGTVRWNGVDIQELDGDELRGRIGAVFQDFMEYDLTVAENIALGDLGALHDRPRIRAAAEAAGFHTVAEALPDGYDTQLSRIFFPTRGATSEDGGPGPAQQAGVLLSGGQWQRLALARALLRSGSELLILDEPSSGLDPAAEAEIHHSLRGLRAGRSSLLISHRLGAVRGADRIVVLADGVVAEQGSHRELLALDGIYAELFRTQAEGYAPVPS
ncbi:ABC transporter ATP-binding protein [Streptacidiphilus sp. PAMC 29251]